MQAEQKKHTEQATALYDLHKARGGKLVAFAGYRLPLHYRDGVLQEHLHTRAKAGLFDVSHMGQARLVPSGEQDVAAAFERLVPSGIANLANGAMRYTVLTNEHGGILDDIIVARQGRDLRLVVNAACKEADFEHIAAALNGIGALCLCDDSLLALQGPASAAVLARLVPKVDALSFMQFGQFEWRGVALTIARCGYTGEDGFEIALPASATADFAGALLADAAVSLIGLGARDSLRLEAGLCLYGCDIDTDTNPIAAGLGFTVAKHRRAAADFAGAEAILADLRDGAPQIRVGIRPEGRAPARAGTAIVDADGAPIGRVTSGGFSPSLQAPIAMGYVARRHAAPQTPITLMIRGKPQAAQIVPLPFVPHRTKR